MKLVIKKLNLQLDKINQSIKESQKEVSRLLKEIRQIEYPFMEISEVEKWVRENSANSKDEDENPILLSITGYQIAPCFINEDDKFQIVNALSDGKFRKGSTVRVHFEFKAWKDFYGK